jgi:Secretion system C-terminal sorting domain
MYQYFAHIKVFLSRLAANPASRLLVIAMLWLAAPTAHAQTLNSIGPDTFYPGQKLRTTITSTGVFMSTSTPQGNIQNILLRNATDSVFANADSTYVVDANTAIAFWTTPTTLVKGVYDLVVRVIDLVTLAVKQYVLNNSIVIKPLPRIKGTVYLDANGNCTQEANEPGLAGRIVVLDNGAQYTVTDSAGEYLFVTDTNTHAVTQIQINPYYVFGCGTGTYTGIHPTTDTTILSQSIPNKIKYNCHRLTVDVVTAEQIPCKRNNKYLVSYRNEGTIAADSVKVIVRFDSIVTVVASTRPWSSHLGNLYTFNIGHVGVDSGGSFIITDSVACSAVLGQSITGQATITPHSYCDTVSGWDSSSVVLSQYYNQGLDSVFFTILNNGFHAVSQPLASRIYEDDILITNISHTLPKDSSKTISVKASGRSLYMEADQSAHHPGYSRPRVFRELVGTGPYSLGHIASVAQDDEDTWTEIDCRTIVAKPRAVGMQVYPSGIGSQHLITPIDELEYIIRFQNTDTHTLQAVVIYDTIDLQHLDPTTIRPAGSSHPYQYTLVGKGIARFTFSNIALIDSHRSSTLSKGFVKFKIHQRAGNPAGTVIRQHATILLDRVYRQLTDTPFVTLQPHDSIFRTGLVEIGATHSLYHIRAYPNPFVGQINFEVQSSEPIRAMLVELIAIDGRVVYQAAAASTFTVPASDLQSGMYLYRIRSGNQIIGTGKLLLK